MGNKFKLLFLLTIIALSGCGKVPASTSDTKIVGGTKVTTTDPIIKSTVALVMPDGFQFCTGSLIAPRVVVTASHCLADYTETKLYVAFGPTAKPGYFATARLRTATRLVVNPNFDTAAMDADVATSPPNDVALVLLSADAPAGYAAVPMLGLTDTITAGETLTLAGFGLTSYLATSAGVLRKVDVKMTAVDTVAKEVEFGDTPGKSACMGDSGGPAFVKRAGKLKLLGVTSRGSSHCDSSGIYTDLRYFRSWLSATAGTSI